MTYLKRIKKSETKETRQTVQPILKTVTYNARQNIQSHYVIIEQYT